MKKCIGWCELNLLSGVDTLIHV